MLWIENLTALRRFIFSYPAPLNRDMTNKKVTAHVPLAPLAQAQRKHVMNAHGENYYENAFFIHFSPVWT